jgi:hypothetical protein
LISGFGEGSAESGADESCADDSDVHSGSSQMDLKPIVTGG